MRSVVPGNDFGTGLGNGNANLGDTGGPPDNFADFLGLEKVSYKTDPLSCTVFVGNVSYYHLNRLCQA